MKGIWNSNLRSSCAVCIFSICRIRFRVIVFCKRSSYGSCLKSFFATLSYCLHKNIICFRLHTVTFPCTWVQQFLNTAIEYKSVCVLHAINNILVHCVHCYKLKLENDSLCIILEWRPPNWKKNPTYRCCRFLVCFVCGSIYGKLFCLAWLWLPRISLKIQLQQIIHKSAAEWCEIMEYSYSCWKLYLSSIYSLWLPKIMQFASFITDKYE